MQSGLLELKAKYGLVHVPPPGKARKWALETRRLILEGSPEEQAGMEAAGRIFRYEYREYAVYQGCSVRKLLDILSL